MPTGHSDCLHFRCDTESCRRHLVNEITVTERMVYSRLFTTALSDVTWHHVTLRHVVRFYNGGIVSQSEGPQQPYWPNQGRKRRKNGEFNRVQDITSEVATTWCASTPPRRIRFQKRRVLVFAHDVTPCSPQGACANAT